MNRYKEVPIDQTHEENEQIKNLVLNRFIHLSNCFAGGVLFSIAILKLYPQSMEGYKIYLEMREVSKENQKDLKEEAFGQRFPFIISIIFMGFILKLVLQLCAEKKRTYKFGFDGDQVSSDSSDKGCLTQPDYIGELVTQRSQVQTEQLDERVPDSEQMEGGDFDGQLNSDNFGKTESVGVVSPSLRQRFPKTKNQLPECDSQSINSMQNGNRNRIILDSAGAADPNQIQMQFYHTESVRSGGSIKSIGQANKRGYQMGAENINTVQIARNNSIN